MNSFHSRGQRPASRRTHERPPPERAAGMVRVDVLLVERKLVESRSRAQELIRAGCVSSDGQTVVKSGQQLPATASLTVTEDERSRFVSRGALKLAAALEHSGVEVRGRACLDVGQSTGGFTDCLLQAGAERVVGIEVGHDQLHPRLRADPRCITFEGLNARALVAADLGLHMPASGFGLIACDASFISLTLLIPCWPGLLAVDGDILALVKPQFELGPDALGKGGVVRNAADYARVEQRIRNAAEEAGLRVCGWYDSPLCGGGVGHIEGNREFLIWMKHRNHDET